MNNVSIVIPVYNEADIIQLFFNKLQEEINKSKYTFEVIFVCDPSSDSTENILKYLIKNKSNFKLIELSRKFGQAASIYCGLDNSTGDAVIVMDADLQDPPEVIHSLIEKWENGAEVVLAVRKSRRENIIKKIIANLGYSFLNKFAEVPVPKNVGDFRLMDKKIVSIIRNFSESRIYLRGIISLIGFNQELVYFDRPKRIVGFTKYNKLFGSLRIALDGIVGFSTALLNLSIFFGIVFTTLAVLIAVSYSVLKIFGFPFPIGNPTIVSLVLLMGSFNLFSIGILGLYIGRIADEVKNRPRYIIKNTVNFKEKNL